MMNNFIIPDGWELKMLADICLDISYGYTASAKQESTGVKLLRITDIQGHVVEWKDVPYCDIDRAKLQQYKLEIGDLVIARTGSSTGMTYVVKNQIDAVFASYLIRFRLNLSIIDYKFADYIFRSQIWSNFINSIKNGSSRDGANAKQMSAFKFAIPSLDKQHNIANILSALDEKIELLKEQNKTFDDLAQTIFKQWFIDFNFPDENGKPYKDSGGIMVDSELGLIPEAWEVSNLDQIADYTNGLAMQKFRPTLEAEVLPVLKIRELRQGFTDLNSDLCKSDIIDKVKINNGDVIFSWSGTLMIGIWCGGECGLNQHLFKVTSSVYPKWFYYLWTKYHLANFISIAETKATTMGHIQRKHLSDAKVYIPKSNILILLDNILNPMLERIVMNCTQSKNLSKLRDALLPKFMSGEIKV